MDEPIENSSAEHETAPPRVTVFQRLRAYFLTGVVVAAPIGITLYVTWAFITWVDDQVTSLMPDAYNPSNYLPFSVPGLGLAAMLVALTLLGMLTANFFGRSLLNIGERVVARMPIIRNVYNAIKQVVETVATGSGKNFQKAALIQYPREGLWTICFLTAQTVGEIQHKTPEDMTSVYVPTTPNPTSGFLIFVPKRELVILDMTVEEAIKMVISTGLVTPPWSAADEPSLPLEGKGADRARDAAQ